MNAFRLLWVTLLVSGRLVAHETAPVIGCEAPVRPPKEDVERWNAFVDQVDVYRACIHAASESHYAQADRHREAAEAAVGAWNEFVRTNLNVPEDFPHESNH